MSEELNLEQVVEQPELDQANIEVEAQKVEPPKLSAIEEEAIKQGWVPKDQWNGDPSEHRSAKEFIERGELLNHIHTQNKKTKQLEEALNQLAEVNKRVEEETRRRTVEELKIKQREAAAIGDVDTVEKTTDKLVELNKPTTATTDNKPITPPEAKEFMEKHKAWFNRENSDNSLMMDFAIRREDILSKEKPDLSITQRLKLVEEEVVRRFPEKFNNPNKETPAPVSGNTAPSVKSKKLSFNDLPQYHKNVVRFAQSNNSNFDVDKYIEQLKMIGEIQ